MAPSELHIDDPYQLTEAFRRPLASGAEVDKMLDTASRAAAAFAATPVAERAALCRAAVGALQARREHVALEITRMMGKPIRQARREVDTCVDRAEHMASIAEACLADTVVGGRAGYERRIEHVPLGVVFNMPAWNYPLLTCVNALVPAVLAGNAVVLKHSSRTALCGEHFATAFAAAGAPSGLVQALHCDHDTAARIAKDARVGYVAFTGSVAGGHAVYRAVSERFIDAGLELGGKDPAYVADDADLPSAAASLVDGACYNAGQSCCAVERVYVHRSRHDELVALCLAEIEKLRLGDPRDEATDVGPMAQASAPAFLAKQVADAHERGAELLFGGAPTQIGDKGRFFQPTLLTRVTHAMDVMRSESFGPLLPIMAVDDDAEALRLMNDSDLGLTASLWTRDRDRAAHLARHIEAGTVYLDTCDVLDPALPWTGVKDSGKGSTLSALGFAHLTRPRSILFKLP